MDMPQPPQGSPVVKSRPINSLQRGLGSTPRIGHQRRPQEPVRPCLTLTLRAARPASLPGPPSTSLPTQQPQTTNSMYAASVKHRKLTDWSTSSVGTVTSKHLKTQLLNTYQNASKPNWVRAVRATKPPHQSLQTPPPFASAYTKSHTALVCLLADRSASDAPSRSPSAVWRP